MILYFFVAVATILLACQIANHPVTISNTITRQQLLNKIYLAAIFSILFLLAALRLEVGNDYGSYVVTCHEIVQNGYVVTEPGYNFIVKLLYALSGKEDYLLMFAFFAFVTTFIFLTTFYKKSDNFTLTFFLFITLGIYFRSFNTVRYYFVLAVTLYSLQYVVKKQYGKFILLILLAALFHKSVLVVIPLYIFANRTFKKWQLGFMGICGVGLMLAKDYVIAIGLKWYPSYIDTPYLKDTLSLTGSLTSIIRCVLVLLLCLMFYRTTITTSKENRLYFNMNLIALFMYVCCSFIPLLSRFTYYLITAQILLIPGVIERIEDKKKKRLVLIATIVIGVIYFVLFLKTASADGIRVLPYKSWLFYEKEWLDATKIF